MSWKKTAVNSGAVFKAVTLLNSRIHPFVPTKFIDIQFLYAIHRGSSNTPSNGIPVQHAFDPAVKFTLSVLSMPLGEKLQAFDSCSVGTGICTHILRPVSTFVHRTLAWCKQLKEDRLLLWIVRRCHLTVPYTHPSCCARNRQRRKTLSQP